MFMLRIRFDTFCTGAGDREFGPHASGKVHIAAAAGLQVASLRFACDRRDIDERKAARVPQQLPQLIAQTASRSCSSGRAPRITPSRLVSINSKSKTAIDSATVGPQLTNNKAHNVARCDRIIVVAPLGPISRGTPSSSASPRIHQE